MQREEGKWLKCEHVELFHFYRLADLPNKLHRPVCSQQSGMVLGVNACPTVREIEDGAGGRCPKCVEWREAERERLMASLPRPLPLATTLPADSAARKEVPLYAGLLAYFPAALAGVARVSKRGSDKHNPGQPMHHSRGKSGDHPDCIARHLVDLREDFGAGVGRDEAGVPQVDYIAWRALALAQEWHEANDGAPLAPAARVGIADSQKLIAEQIAKIAKL